MSLSLSSTMFDTNVGPKFSGVVLELIRKKVGYAFRGSLSSSSDIFVSIIITLIYPQCCTYERHNAKITYSTA